MKIVLETERLVLREFEPGDTEFILHLLNSPGWLEFIGDRNVRTVEAARQYLVDGPIKSYASNGFGLFMVSLKTDHTPIGMCGLISRDELLDVDIGFAFLPEYTGKGYAYEIAAATLAYGMEVLRLPRIVAITDPANDKSIRLLEKIGLRFSKKIRFGAKQEELLMFSTSGQTASPTAKD